MFSKKGTKSEGRGEYEAQPHSVISRRFYPCRFDQGRCKIPFNLKPLLVVVGSYLILSDLVPSYPIFIFIFLSTFILLSLSYLILPCLLLAYLMLHNIPSCGSRKAASRGCGLR